MALADYEMRLVCADRIRFNDKIYSDPKASRRRRNKVALMCYPYGETMYRIFVWDMRRQCKGEEIDIETGLCTTQT